MVVYNARKVQKVSRVPDNTINMQDYVAQQNAVLELYSTGRICYDTMMAYLSNIEAYAKT